MHMEKHVFFKTMFRNGLNMGFLQQDWIQKTVHGEEIDWLFCKEKFLGTAVFKESHAGSVLRYERCNHY